MSIASILRGHEFFHNLGLDEVEAVSGFSEKLYYSRSDQIFTHARKADKVYLLLKGAVLLRFPPGKGEAQMIIARIEKGELFGISPLLGAETYGVDALCSEDAEVLEIEAGQLLDRALLVRGRRACHLGRCVSDAGAGARIPPDSLLVVA